MRNRKNVTGILSFLCLMILILDSKTALEGAQAGIQLSIRTVVPSLFPFIFLCSLLIESLWGKKIPGSVQLCRILGIPQGAESLLISAFLGGYPAGAQMIGESYQQKRLSRKSAEHLLRFCSNAGPSFLFGITAVQFPRIDIVWTLWGIHIAAALFIGMMYAPAVPDTAAIKQNGSTVAHILRNSIKATAMICGWIMIFRILTEFLNKWILWLCPHGLKILITGLLELSNGCCLLSSVESISLRFLLCTAMLSFGGFCVALQTSAVIGDLSLRTYLHGKIIHLIVSILFAVLYICKLGYVILIIIVAAAMVSKHRKKDVAFLKQKVYNTDINSGGFSHAVS